MPPEIRELDAETRDRIAAGEVIERPASVVKELLENALDADASRIEVSVEDDGTERISVTDDGVGMSRSAVRTAVREHTTSKLRSASELDAIDTLGFRGEALHAIGSVARMTIRTRPRAASGTKLVVEDGEVVDCGPVGCPEGTAVEVTELFGTVPARRKYLKTAATEFDHIRRIVTGYALASPDVAITLTRGDREIFATVGDGNRRSAVLETYGREVAASMIDVDSERPNDGPVEAVSGLVSHPETNRSSREYVTTLLDGRYVTAGAIREAIVDAYGDAIAPDRYPFAVIDVGLPSGGADINVHPRKLEVLFADEAGVKAAVTEAVESALSADGLLRSRAPRGRSAPEQTEIDTDRRSNAETDPTTAGSDDRSGSDPATRRPPERSDDRVSDATRSDRSPQTDAVDGSGGVDASADTGDSNVSDGSAAADDSGDSDDSTDSDDDPPVATGDSTSGTPDGADDPDHDAAEFTAIDDRIAATQRTLDGDSPPNPSLEQLPVRDVLGQFEDTYLVCEGDDGLLLVDQHAADERVHYERLRERFDGVTTQTLAEPIEVELTAGEAALLEDAESALARLGFRVRRGTDRSVVVQTVPSLLVAETDAEPIVRDLIAAIAEDTADPDRTVDAIADDILADLACHPAVTGNTSLTEGSVLDLLSALDDCENPYACPHGRPTVIELSTEEIATRFERDYPGHAGRRR
ncbi:MAG: DNA mismatch repair endonuclease MutL [Natronomonas sp.]